MYLYFQVPPKPEETDSFALFTENNIKHRSCRDLIEFLDDVSLLLKSFYTRCNQQCQYERSFLDILKFFRK